MISGVLAVCVGYVSALTPLAASPALFPGAAALHAQKHPVTESASFISCLLKRRLHLDEMTIIRDQANLKTLKSQNLGEKTKDKRDHSEQNMKHSWLMRS